MGGWTTEWTESAEFPMLLTLNSSMEAKIAEKQGVEDIYTGQVERDFPIAFNDYFKRPADGAFFNVTSNPDEDATPKDAGLSYKVFSAKKVAVLA